jgi:hypothetical protein
MSATTIAVATTTETVDPPPGSRLGQAALPVPDTAISVHALGAHARPISSCRLTSLDSSKVNNDLNLGMNSVSLYQNAHPGRLRHREKKAAFPQSRHDFVFTLAFRDGEFFSEA